MDMSSKHSRSSRVPGLAVPGAGAYEASHPAISAARYLLGQYASLTEFAARGRIPRRRS